MRSLLDTEEEGQASEVTLSTASLLGIFFGLVLICGVFFGFGYSMGRGTGLGTQALKVNTAAEASPPIPEETKTAENAPPPPVVQEEQQDATPPVTDAPSPAPAPKPVETVAPPTPSERPSPAHPISHGLDTVEKAAIDSTTTPDLTAAPRQPVVQIAAVAHQHDADVLVAALRQRGFGVVVRNEPQDNLWHVQLGPFADRSQAAAMKQKLLAAGYNAIVKQ